MLQNGIDFSLPFPGALLVLTAVLYAQNGSLGPPHAMDSPVSAFPPLQFPLLAPLMEWRGVFMLLLSRMCTNIYTFATVFINK